MRYVKRAKFNRVCPVIDIIWEDEDVITTNSDFDDMFPDLGGGGGIGSCCCTCAQITTGSLLGLFNPFRQCCP